MKLLDKIHKAESLPTTILSVVIDNALEIAKFIISIPFETVKNLIKKDE